MLTYKRIRNIAAFGLAAAIAVPVLAGVAGAAKGTGGGVVQPPVVTPVAAKLRADLVPVVLPACSGALTGCQTANPLLVDPAIAAIPVPGAVVDRTKARLHMPALDPALFPTTGCLATYKLGSITATSSLIAAIAPEVGNIADFRTTVAPGSILAGTIATIDVACNFTSAPVTGRRGVIITPAQPVHTETHWTGVLA